MSSEKRITRSSRVKPQMDLNKETIIPNQEEKIEKKRGRKKGKKVISHDVTTTPTKTPLKSSEKGGRVLRSMSNSTKKTKEENPNSEQNPNPEQTLITKKVLSGKKRGRKPTNSTKLSKSTELNTLRNRVRNLVSKISFEQNLINAYSTDGWKGQSLEKLRPEKELDRAKAQIIKCKLRIRDTFKQLESILSEGKHDLSLFDAKGEIDCNDIFCAKCKLKNETLNNDIILCDGICDRGFHQNCLNPPLLTKDIPPGDEGWLCPACDCKVDCVELLNDSQGVHLTLGDNWEKVFPEAVALANGGVQLDASDLPSDDSDDDDFDPDKITNHDDDINNNNDDHDDNNDDDDDEEEDDSSDDSDFYTDSDDEDNKNKNKNNNNKVKGNNNKEINIEDLPSEDSDDDDFCEKESDDSDASDDFSSDSDDFCREIVKNKQSSGGDTPLYQPIHQEIFGDEDSSEKKRTKRVKATKNSTNNSPTNKNKSFGLDKNKTLKEYFETNQYPSQETKTILAEELGLAYQQVNKWFESARRKTRTKTPIQIQTPQNSSPTPQKSSQTPQKSSQTPQKSTGSKKRARPTKSSSTKSAQNLSLSKCDATSEPLTPVSVKKSGKSAASTSTNGAQSPMDSDRKKAIMRELRRQKMGR